MAFDYHSYAQLAGNDGQRQWQETQSIHAPSFVSTDSFEMRSYRGDSSRSRLLSQSSIPYARDDAPYLQSEPPLDFAKAGPGLWKNQMLVDRSLRGMALLTSIFALGMMIVVFVWLPKYTQNENSESTSVFAVKESCKTASIKNLVSVDQICLPSLTLLRSSIW